MAEGRQESDANEPASAYKLQKAHERGSIVRSAEVTFAFVLLTALACVEGLGEGLLQRAGQLIHRGLSVLASSRALSKAEMLSWAIDLGAGATTLVAPVVFALWVAGLITAALQARGVWSAEPLKPDFSRLNPTQAIRRIFSTRLLGELLRACLKLGLITVAAAIWGRHHATAVAHLPTSAPSLARQALGLAGSLLGLLCGLVALIAFVDWLFNRWNYLRDARMSKREVKEEAKEREGDPRIKARLRELRAQWLRRARQLASVRNADVLVTNPTHYAVALEYRRAEMSAPMISARGAGELAMRMRAEARRRGVPVVEQPALARALFALSDSEIYVPEAHFESVARILRWVYAARGQRDKRTGTT